MAIANIFISIPLIKIWGAKGAALGTAISLILCNGIFMNLYYQKRIGIDIIYFWKQIGKFIPAFIPTVVVGCLLRIFWNMSSFTGFLVAGGIYFSVFCVSMWKLGMNESERIMIIGPLNRICKRLGK